ncbi:flagellar biosynthesis protein FlhF [Aestuariirhabdus litorea]|uniref:Flagellar biosynthesis protein FlhF n=1 Tax=Aestuariirhabdus litorea TaxID=2528527 RepID=A0A3P3VQD0_9GAMM|nr:flagellar biosynthesis protein FlhF [Aestuariirhabdus litorea]RRJ84982.1 flagellar biosynthesis protein FlhF [Aestuariirhabdus litorea]RWW98207.1 flagellar biosynthesis protein FlhF [Endozoicomonadaceae bacterium GTF-13]
MNIKRYFASDMRQAMKLVKDDLGDDAAILSQRRVAGGVEVSAAVDASLPRSEAFGSAGGSRGLDKALADARRKVVAAEHGLGDAEAELPRIGEASVATTDAMRQTLKSLQQGRHSAPVQAEAQPDSRSQGGAQQQALESMRDELNNMKELLQQQLGSVAWGQFVERSPQQAMFWRRLSGMGLSADLCKQLLAVVEPGMPAAHNWRQVLAALSRQLSTTQKNLVMEGGIFAFIGPTGSGKTTTIGKLATQYVLEHGPEQVALVTTDCYRVGAAEQIKALGRILNVTVRVVDNPRQLQPTLDGLSRKALVLIDTAGLHHQDPNLALQLGMLNEVRPMVRSLLVLACTSQQQVMRAAYHTYGGARLVGTVFTKVDEATSLGEAISLVCEHGLPVSYVADGQRIPEDISQARAHGLISRAVAISDQLPADDEKMIGSFALSRGGANHYSARYVS